jgi:hypothetical protein
MEKETCQLNVLSRLIHIMPSCITALKDGYYFIGSVLQDCVLGRIEEDFFGNPNHFRVIECFTNHGPVNELCIMRPCGGVVTHSGVDLPRRTFASYSKRLSNAWVLREENNYLLIVSAKRTTKTLVIVDNVHVTVIKGANPARFDTGAETICCCNLGRAAVQVTPVIVFFFRGSQGNGVSWQPKLGRITAAAGNGQLLALALTDCKLVLFLTHCH